jgi:predicted transcriptional regulator
MKFIKSFNNICCDDVIKCVFDLNVLDLNVYKELKKNGQCRADDLAKKMNRERSTIYRSLQKLTCCELCIKQTNTIETGGYYHVYSCNNLKDVKKKLENCVDNWYKSMKEMIKLFD